MNPLFDQGYRPEDLEVQVTELLVATSDESDHLVDQSIIDVLRLLRDRMKMDVVFVSQFTEGQRVIRYVDTDPVNPLLAVGDADPLEVSWCQRVVDGRLPEYIPDARALPASAALLQNLPFSIGTHISTPIVLASGEVYGTLCTFSQAPQDDPDHNDLKVLRYTAKLAAGKIEGRRERERQDMAAPDLSLVPLERKRSL
jgi:GAF domain-containing protein